MKLNHHHNHLHQPWRLVLATGIVFVALISARAASDSSSIERALRKLDSQWSAAASAKNLDQVVSYYSSDAIVLAPNMPLANTGGAIRKIWKGELNGMISGGWKPTRIEVTKSGEMAYISGTYTWVGKGADGKEMKDKGKYLEVWKKQADGSWKCSADCWNSNLPLPGEKG
jgi:ketosteroid isomerase-like protein